MRVATNGIGINVEEQGGGDLALVFLHYWGGSCRTWRHVTTALAASYHTIAVDHRGWGESDAPEAGYALGDLADDAEGVIRALDLRRYIVVGHSMGGKVAQSLASRRPGGHWSVSCSSPPRRHRHWRSSGRHGKRWPEPTRRATPWRRPSIMS